ASNFGSPESIRCSQVTIFRSRLFKTTISNRGSFQVFQYFATVISSFSPSICIAPSPEIATAIRSGYAILAATAYGTAGHMVARFPDSDANIPLRIRKFRAYQNAEVPESAVTTLKSGSLGERRC